MAGARSLSKDPGAAASKRGLVSEEISLWLGDAERSRFLAYAHAQGMAGGALAREWIDAYIADPASHCERIEALGPAAPASDPKARRCMSMRVGFQRRIAFKEAAARQGADQSGLLRSWISRCPDAIAKAEPKPARASRRPGKQDTDNLTVILDSPISAAFISLCRKHGILRPAAAAAWMDFLAQPSHAGKAVAALSAVECEAIGSKLGKPKDRVGDGRSARSKNGRTTAMIRVDAGLHARASSQLLAFGMGIHAALSRLILLALEAQSLDIESLLRVAGPSRGQSALASPTPTPRVISRTRPGRKPAGAAEAPGPALAKTQLFVPLHQDTRARLLEGCAKKGIKPAALLRAWIAAFLAGDEEALPAGARELAPAAADTQTRPDRRWANGIGTRISRDERERFRKRAAEEGATAQAIVRAWVERFVESA